MSLVQRRRSKSRESKTASSGIVSGVEAFWRNTIACSPQLRPASSRERSSRPVLRARSQCYVRRVEGDDGAARRLANLAYQGSDGDLSPRLLSPGGSPPLEKADVASSNAGGTTTTPPETGAGSSSSTASTAFSRTKEAANDQRSRLLFPPPTYTHIPSAISTPSRYPVLGIPGRGPLSRSQSARGRHVALSPTKTEYSSPLSTVSSSSQVGLPYV